MTGATLTRNVQWSKVVVMNVPCRKLRSLPSAEDASEEDQPMHENEEIESYWTPEDLDNQMKINPSTRGSTSPRNQTGPLPLTE